MINDRLVTGAAAALRATPSLRVVVVVGPGLAAETFAAVRRELARLGVAMLASRGTSLTLGGAPRRPDPSLNVIAVHGAVTGARIDQVWAEQGVREEHRAWWQTGIGARLCVGGRVVVVPSAVSATGPLSE